MNEPIPNPPQAMLIGGHLIVELTVPPPESSPLPPVVVRVIPFTRPEGRVYDDEMKKLKDNPAEQESHQCKVFAERIKQWNVTLGGVTVPINQGTVANLPAFAFQPIENALYCSGGVLVGNSSDSFGFSAVARSGSEHAETAPAGK